MFDFQVFRRAEAKTFPGDRTRKKGKRKRKKKGKKKEKKKKQKKNWK